MIYLYDVWVNWFEGEEQGYNVCPYHEWRKNDTIEVLEQVPLIYITEDLFNYIENSLQDIPSKLLERIHKRCYKRKGHQRQVLDYVCILTDGRGILAIDTSGYNIPIRKSRLIPRQEQQVFERCEKAVQQDFSFTPLNEDSVTSSMSPPKNEMLGLTRRERQLKKILMIAMDQLKTSNNRNELLYWLAEWENKELYADLYDRPINEIWQSLYDDIKIGWGASHEKLCKQLIKGNPFLEKFWKKEQVFNESK